MPDPTTQQTKTSLGLPTYNRYGYSPLLLWLYEGEYDMLLTTTTTLEGMRVVRYLGIVDGTAILGANIFKDLFAGIRDVIGGRSAAYERELEQARTIALQEMSERAAHLGANAIIAVDLDYETINMGNGGSMLMVSASGTAVVVEQSAPPQPYYQG
jgi:uncharacterized protein YbjQ (UPF0145 family)